MLAVKDKRTSELTPELGLAVSIESMGGVTIASGTYHLKCSVPSQWGPTT